MNILQVISRLDEKPGAQDVIDSTRFLTLNGHKIVVASGSSERVREIDEVGARHYPMNFANNIFLLPLFVFKLSRIIGKESIDVVHSRDGLSAFLSFLASRSRARAFVATLYKNRIKGFFDKSQTWAKCVICSSENQARYILEKGLVPGHKICVIPPFVKVTSLSAGKPYGLRNFFIVGGLLPLSSSEKTQKFIRAISILSRTIGRLKVFVIDTKKGRGKGDTEKFELLVKRHLLNGIIAFLPKEEIQKTLPAFDVLALMEDDEDMAARFLLEAQSRRIPVLVSESAGWIKDYGSVGETLIAADMGEARNLADNIFNLYKNEAKRSNIADEAQKFVNEKFDIKKAMESTVRVYSDAPRSKNILIIKIAALGDVILAVPSIRAIRKKFEHAKIKLLVGIENRDVFINSPFFDDLIVYDFKGRDKGLNGLLRLAKRLRKEGFDIVVDFQNNKRSHLLAFLSCAPERYGYDNGKLGFLLNKKAKDIEPSIDPIAHQGRVLDLLGIRNIDKKLELWPSKEDRLWADDFLKSYWVNPALSYSGELLRSRKGGVKTKARLVALNIGSSPRWITKLWPVEYFSEVADRLAGEFGVRIVLIGKEKKGQRIEEFLKNTISKPINALGKTNVPRLASLLKRCDVLVSSDSAPLHVAASVGTPFVAFFGPTDPARHLPPSNNYVVLKKNIECSPCYSTRCKRDHACMRSIKPDEVFESIIKLLGLK